MVCNRICRNSHNAQLSRAREIGPYRVEDPRARGAPLAKFKHSRRERPVMTRAKCRCRASATPPSMGSAPRTVASLEAGAIARLTMRALTSSRYRRLAIPPPSAKSFVTTGDDQSMSEPHSARSSPPPTAPATSVNQPITKQQCLHHFVGSSDKCLRLL